MRARAYHASRQPARVAIATAARRAARSRLEVSAITRARTPDGERTVRIVGLSARTALLVAPEPLGWAGQCIDLDVPTVGGRDLSVMAGIARSEQCKEGHVITVEFVVIDADVRRQLNELLALLLAGEPDADARQPRVVYDVVVAYGPTGARQAHLQEISLSGFSMRIAERIAHDVILDVAVPALRGDATVGAARPRHRPAALGRGRLYHRARPRAAGRNATPRALSARSCADLMCR